jgi:hypothetical protein
MKAHGGVDVQILIFLTLSLVGGEWSASRPCRFIPGTHLIRVWVGPRAGLDDVEEKNSWLYRDSDPSAVQPAASRCTDWAIPAPRVAYKAENFLANWVSISFSRSLLLSPVIVLTMSVTMKHEVGCCILEYDRCVSCSLLKGKLPHRRDSALLRQV